MSGSAATQPGSDQQLKMTQYAFDHASIGILWISGDGRIIDANKAACRVLGYERSLLLGMRVFDVVVDLDAEGWSVHWQELAGSGPLLTSLKAETSDRGLIDLEVTDHYLEYEGQAYACAFVLDVTERLQEQHLLQRYAEQQRLLSRRLVSIQEEERDRVAHQVHDEFGQTLTALRMDLAWLQHRIADPEMCQRISGMITLVDGTLVTVRRIFADLRPGILDDLGLAAALEWLVEEQAKRGGYQFRLDLAEQTLARSTTTTLFRIAQQALANVIEHAEATIVEVGLHRDDNDVVLTVRDDGVGMGAAVVHGPLSLGLVGMRERATAIGGSMVIESTPGKGTFLQVRVPFLDRDIP